MPDPQVTQSAASLTDSIIGTFVGGAIPSGVALWLTVRFLGEKIDMVARDLRDHLRDHLNGRI